MIKDKFKQLERDVEPVWGPSIEDRLKRVDTAKRLDTAGRLGRSVGAPWQGPSIADRLKRFDTLSWQGPSIVDRFKRLDTAKRLDREQPPVLQPLQEVPGYLARNYYQNRAAAPSSPRDAARWPGWSAPWPPWAEWRTYSDYWDELEREPWGWLRR